MRPETEPLTLEHPAALNLFEVRVIGVVGRRGGPGGEDTVDADVFRQHTGHFLRRGFLGEAIVWHAPEGTLKFIVIGSQIWTRGV